MTAPYTIFFKATTNYCIVIIILVLAGADWLVVRGCFVAVEDDDPVGVASLKSCSNGLASSNS